MFGPATSVLRWLPVLRLVSLILGIASSSGADAGLNGEVVPKLQALDQIVENYKAVHPRAGGVLAVSKNSCIVYQRGFGGVQENAPMRLMSIEKGFTAAAIHDLVNRGELGLGERAFDLGQTPPGILSIPPRPSLASGGDGLRYVTVENLLHHQGGWYQNESGDHMFKARQIAHDLNVPSPPSRSNIVSWVLGKPLDFYPGTGCENHVDSHDLSSPYSSGCGNKYSNFGYMVLGLIIEARSGMSVAQYVRTRLLEPGDWSPATDVYMGRTLPPDRGAREPFYVGTGQEESVFDAGQTPHTDYVYPRLVNKPDGRWHIESMQGHGNLVASAVPLSRFLDRYVAMGADAGKRRISVPKFGGLGIVGSLDGTSTIGIQRDDGVNIVVLMNDRDQNDAGTLAKAVETWIVSLDPTFVWPEHCVDGFWVSFGSPVSVHGSFERPFGSMENLLTQTTDGSKVQLHPNTSTTWKGTITKRMMITAPLGPAKIGAQ